MTLEQPEFRKALIENPQGATCTAFDTELPVGFKIIVIEEEADELHIILPPPVSSPMAKSSGGLWAWVKAVLTSRSYGGEDENTPTDLCGGVRGRISN